MKVFISWSGERSQKVAELFKTWLKCVIQASDPWISTQDIQSGSWWFNEIGEQLSGTNIGIVCLTNANKNKPWILFETGALAKGLSSSRVCPFLIDLNPGDVAPPLSQLNLATPDKQSVYSLVRTINHSLNEKALSSDVLERVFNTYWNQFEDAFSNILATTPQEPGSESRPENDILNEILSTVRTFDKRLRKVEIVNNTAKHNGFNGNHLPALNDYIRKYVGIKINEVGSYETSSFIDMATKELSLQLPYSPTQIEDSIREALRYHKIII